MVVPHELPGKQSRAASERGRLDSADRLGLDAWGVLGLDSQGNLAWIYEQDLGDVLGSSRDTHLPARSQIALIQYSSHTAARAPRAGRLAVASTAPGRDRPRAGPSSQAVCEGWGPGAPGTSTAQCPGSHPAGPSSPVHPGSCAGRSGPSLPLLLGRAPQVRPWPLPLPPGPAAPNGPTGEQAPASLPALPSASA